MDFFKLYERIIQYKPPFIIKGWKRYALPFLTYLILCYNLAASFIIRRTFEEAYYNINRTLWLLVVLALLCLCVEDEDTWRYLLVFPISSRSVYQIVTGSAGSGIWVYLFAICVIGLAIVLFCRSSVTKWIKIIVGVVSSFLMIPTIFFTILAILFNAAGASKITYYSSPNGDYECEVLISDKGALGGDTYATVYKPDQNINVFFGEITFPLAYFRSLWVLPENLVVDWPEDETIIINGNVWHWREETHYDMKTGEPHGV